MAQDKAGTGNGSRSKSAASNDARAPSRKIQGNGRAAPVEESADGFFVDAAPSERVQRPDLGPADDPRSARPGNGSGRAADRRREQGRAPAPAEPKDTRTSLKQNERQPDRQPDRQLDRQSEKLPAVSGAVATLTCVKGPEQGTTLPLTDGSYTIGRARENQLVLKDIAASRKHLRLDVERGRVRLIDLGSGNGTKVNGKRAGELELRHGDTVEIGSSLLLFAEAGKAAPPPDQSRDDAQARVVAAADELAKELSQKLRFGEEGFDDGFVAKTRALKTADARAVAEQIQREAQQQQQQKKSPDKLWNETFTNMPLSAVVATDQALQGGAGREAREDRNAAAAADVPRRATRNPMPAPPFQPPPRAPQGTNVADDASQMSALSQGQDFSENLSASGRRGSFVTSVLLSAGVVVVVGALALGLWAIFVKDDGKKGDDALAAVNAEREAEYATAIRRAQDAYARQDWVAVRDYAVAALQVKPNDVMSTTYKRDAELKLDSALKAQQTAPTPQNVAPPPTQPQTPPPPPPPTEVKLQEAPPPPPAETVKPKPPPPPTESVKPKPKPTPAPKPPPPAPKPRKGMSDAEARDQFERAIDAFRSKDDETACKLLDKVADRAPSESVWKGKAESLYLKKCGG